MTPMPLVRRAEDAKRLLRRQPRRELRLAMRLALEWAAWTTKPSSANASIERRPERGAFLVSAQGRKALATHLTQAPIAYLAIGGAAFRAYEGRQRNQAPAVQDAKRPMVGMDY